MAALLVALRLEAGAATWYWHGDLSTAARFTSSVHWTSNQDGTGNRPPSIKDDAFDDAPLAPWIPYDAVRDGESRADCAANPGKLTLSGRGADYWTDPYGSSSQFSGVFRDDLRGDFDVTVKLESRSDTHPWSKAGIMALHDPAKPEEGGAAYIAVSPSTGVGFYSDTAGPVGTINAYWAALEGVASGTFPVWLRLVKRSGAFKAYYKKTPSSPWIQVGPAVTPQGPVRDSRVGLFNISHDTTRTSVAVFDDFHGGGALGNQPIDLSLLGTGPGHDGNAELDADWAVKSIDFGNFRGAFSFGGRTLSVAGGASFSAAMNVTADPGRLVFTGSGSDVLVPPGPGQALPEVFKSGTGVLTLAGKLRAAKYIQTAGSLDLGGYDLDLSKEIQVLGGPLPFLNLSGRTLSVAGNATLWGAEGSSLDLAPAAPWFLKVSGTISAKRARVGNSVASQSPGVADSGATDGGGNTNWSFPRACALSASPDTSVAEGQPFRLTAANPCGGRLSWLQVSGPNVRILDPEAAIQEFAAPRVAGDTVLVFRAEWSSGTSVLSAETRVTVRETVPDPEFTLPQGWSWDGRSALILKPALLNGPALAKGPALVYAWSLAGFEAKMETKRDSLVLADPDRSGPVEVRLCLSNGAVPVCAVAKGSIALPSSALGGLAASARGALALSDARLIWTGPCRARILALDGRVLWMRRGDRGTAIDLPSGLGQALTRRTARLTTQP